MLAVEAQDALGRRVFLRHAFVVADPTPRRPAFLADITMGENVRISTIGGEDGAKAADNYYGDACVQWVATMEEPAGHATKQWTDSQYETNESWLHCVTVARYGAGPWGTKVAGMPKGTTAQWIWPEPGQELHRRPSELVPMLSLKPEATISIAATADSMYALYLNGELIGSGAQWQQCGLLRWLKPKLGRNVVAAIVQDSSGTNRLLVALSNPHPPHPRP